MARDDRANGATAANAVRKMNSLETVQASRCTRGSRMFDSSHLLVDTWHSHFIPPSLLMIIFGTGLSKCFSIGYESLCTRNWAEKQRQIMIRVKNHGRSGCRVSACVSVDCELDDGMAGAGWESDRSNISLGQRGQCARRPPPFLPHNRQALYMTSPE